MADDAFTWGGGGEKQTSGRRRLAESLIMEGTQTTPIKSSWQGLNRVAQALLGSQMINEEDARGRAIEQATQQQLLSHPALNGGASGSERLVGALASPGPIVPNDANAIPGTVGMNQALADKTQDFIQDNPGTSMTSGMRSTADQAQLYANRGSNPNPVAPPGRHCMNAEWPLIWRHVSAATINVASVRPCSTGRKRSCPCAVGAGRRFPARERTGNAGL